MERALDRNNTARRAPNFGASATARSIAARVPLITTWPGALSLAAAQTSPSLAALGELLRLGQLRSKKSRHRALGGSR